MKLFLLSLADHHRYFVILAVLTATTLVGIRRANAIVISIDSSSYLFSETLSHSETQVIGTHLESVTTSASQEPYSANATYSFTNSLTSAVFRVEGQTTYSGTNRLVLQFSLGETVYYSVTGGFEGAGGTSDPFSALVDFTDWPQTSAHFYGEGTGGQGTASAKWDGIANETPHSVLQGSNTGILTPGDYRFTFAFRSDYWGDPITSPPGASGMVLLELTTANVSEGGSSAALFGLALIGIRLIRRYRH